MKRKGHYKLLTKLMTLILSGTMVFGPWTTAYAENASKGDNTTIVEKKGDRKDRTTGLVHADTNIYHRESSSSSNFLLTSAEQSYPERYRADEQPWAEGIKVKDQLNGGTCWAFSMTTAAEYSYAKETFDELGPVKEISPGHLAYFSYNRQPDPLGNTDGDISEFQYDWVEKGGDAYVNGLQFLSQWSGLCLEEKAPYSNINDHINTDTYKWDGSPAPYDASLAYDDYVVVENLNFFASLDQNEIKDQIMNYGAVVGAVYFDYYTYMNYDTNSFYYFSDKTTTNHNVVIVGWDDDYPKENFTHTKDLNGDPLSIDRYVLSDAEAAEYTTPPGDGAWIVQNSWGDYLDNGFFYISYYSNDLPYDQIISFNMMAADTYKYNFFYDGTISGFHSLDGHLSDFETNSDAKAANVFTNNTGENITVDAVGFTNFDASAAHYSISVYTDIQDPYDPESGLLAATASVIPENASIQTVKLNTPVQVGTGESYSVVLSFPEEECALGLEISGYNNLFNYRVQTKPCQSFFFKSGLDEWVDLDNYNACYRIRAFANPTDTIPELEIPEEPEKNELIYESAAQQLVTAGKAIHGKMLYALGSDNVTAPTNGYSTEIPTGISAGEYHVWYKAKADYDDEETEPVCISVVIDPKNVKITAKDQKVTSADSIESSLDQVKVEGLAEGDHLVDIVLHAEEAIGYLFPIIIPSEALIENKSHENVTSNYLIDYHYGKTIIKEEIKPKPTPVPVDPEPVPVEIATKPVPVEIATESEPDPAAVQLQKDKDSFSTYKISQISYAASLVLSNDTAADKKLITDAKSAIAALTYDESKTLEQNKKEVDDIIKQLTASLKAQRESEKKTDYSSEWVKGKWYNKDGTQTYKPLGKWYKNKKGWWYEDESGWYPKNIWQKIDGKWYYFKADGYAAAGEYVQGWWLDAKTCQCTYPYKAMWHKNNKGWWYGDASGWYARNGSFIIDGISYTFNRWGYLTD